MAVKESSPQKKTTNSTVSSGQKSAAEIRAWYEKNKKSIENYERAQGSILQLIDPTVNYTRTSNTFSKDTLRTYMQNPTTQYRNLRNLSRFLYYRSQVYRRIIHYNANMINLNYRSVVPNIDFTKDVDTETVLSDYYETLGILSKINLNLEFLKVYITCWRDDIFYGCAYYDDTGYFILPLDPDYCKVTGIYPTGDLAFDMDMSYFTRRQEQLEYWGEPFQSMWDAYQSDTTNGRWQPMTDENCVCLKVNIDDWEIPLPPYMGLFNSLINLTDLEDIQAIADEQQIYKLLVATIPLINGSDSVDDFAVDIKTAIHYFNRLSENLPDYSNAAILPGLSLQAISFDSDQANDTSKIENSTKTVLNTSGGAQVLNSSTVSGTTAWTGAIKSDQKYAMESLLPQTQAYLNRFLSYQVSNPSRVKLLEVSEYTKEEFKNSVRLDATYGMPTKLMLNTLNGMSELDTLSMNFLEENCLNLSSKLVPLQSSNTMDTGELADTEPLTDDGEDSIDKADNAK